MQSSTEVCNFCQEPVDDEALIVRDGAISVGVHVRLVQGNRRYSGRLGTVIGTSLIFPSVFIVRVGDETLQVRHDHLMLASRIDSNKHYRELYEHRIRCDRYEYPASRL